MHEMIGEEGLRLAEALLEQAPETTAADLGTVAGKAGDLLPRMLLVGSTDGHLEPHPVADGGDFAEGHAGLRHAEGAGIHAQEEHLLRAGGGITTQVGLMGSPGIVQRLIDEIGRRGKRSARQGFP